MIVHTLQPSHGSLKRPVPAWIGLACLLSALILVIPGGARSLAEVQPPLEGDADEAVDWGALLRTDGLRFAAARAEFRRAQDLIEAGEKERALVGLARANELDPSFAPPHFTAARVHLMGVDPLFIPETLDGFKALLAGYRSQSRLAANALLVTDMVLAATLAWLVFVLLLRYLPFFQHQLRGKLEGESHRAGRGLLLWLPVLAPFALALGVIPTLSLALIPIWLYAGRRERVLLGLLVGWFALQGVLPAPFSTLLAGVEEDSRPSLVYRASYENPTEALAKEIRGALAEDAGDADLNFALGLVQARRGDFQRSNKSFTESMRLRRDDPQATTNLANNHYYLGDYERAVAGYQRSASLDPSAGSTHYNLAQAYIKKLFFKEGGASMLRASQNGFEIGTVEHRLPPGAVYYQHPNTERLWSMAWKDKSALRTYDLLSPWQRLLGVPVEHLGWWLLGSLIACIFLQRVWRREHLVFECANCGVLACPDCSGEHDGSVLCHGCFATAERAKSELVLSTLLRNRRRATEISFLMKVRRLNAWAFGAGEVYNGLRKRGVFFALLLAMFTIGLVRPGLPLPDPWANVPEGLVAGQRLVSAVGLALLYFLARYGRSVWRTRQFHLHPASIVRLTDLIDGRSERKLKA